MFGNVGDVGFDLLNRGVVFIQERRDNLVCLRGVQGNAVVPDGGGPVESNVIWGGGDCGEHTQVQFGGDREMIRCVEGMFFLDSACDHDCGCDKVPNYVVGSC